MSDIAAWQEWIGRSDVMTQVADVDSLRRFAFACGWDHDLCSEPPPLAHWAWFLDAVPDAAIGPDGHARRGGFLPPVSLPRRMFAAARVAFHGEIALGAEARMERRIVDVQRKQGQSGELVFVAVERRLSQAGELRVSEHQTLVYREIGDAVPLPHVADAPAEGEPWQPGPVELFRFSAATFNSHRIHYDRDYARKVEHYPDLVVQGPFAVARLAGVAARRGRIAELEFRALAPLFVGQPVSLVEREDGAFEARRCDGVTALRMTLGYV